MGKFKHGINGAFTGLVGDLVSSSWRGKPYLKSRPVRKKKAGESELANRSSFGSASKWLSPLTDFFRAGFRGDNPDFWGFHGAKSYLHAHAIVLDGTKKVIDPSKMMISQGDLPLGKGFEMLFNPDTSEICISWDPNPPSSRRGARKAANDDKLMLAVYDVENGDVYGEVYGVSRKVGASHVEIPPETASYHVYAAFVAADSSSRSDSVYLGRVDVA